MKKYTCEECGKQISWCGAHGKGRCLSCYFKTLVGKGNPNHKHGKTYNNHCLDCDKLLGNYRSKRCKSCAKKGKLHHRFGLPPVHGKGQYYKNIWMRSRFETEFAKYLDKNKIKWLYEPKVFNLGNCTYTPDFYLSKTEEYIEIKGYWREDAKKKFKLFKRLFPEVKIEVLTRVKLGKMGIKV